MLRAAIPNGSINILVHPVSVNGFPASCPSLLTLPPAVNIIGADSRYPEEMKMDNMWLVFFWSGPIGVGIFLVCLGTFIWLLAKANEANKRNRT